MTERLENCQVSDTFFHACDACWLVFDGAKNVLICWISASSNETLRVQRPLKEWVFTKDHYFSRDLQSTIPRDYYFNGL